MDATQALDTAKAIVGDRATLTLHHAEHQQAIRISGVFADEAGSLAREILVGLFGQPDPGNGIYQNDNRIGYEYNAPFALVWLP